MNDTVLAADGLIKRYQEGQGELEVLSGVNLTVRRGDTAAIVGASGSGKSTLLNLLGGLDAPSEGTVAIGGQPLAGLNDRGWAASATTTWVSSTSSTTCCRNSPPWRTWPCRC